MFQSPKMTDFKLWKTYHTTGSLIKVRNYGKHCQGTYTNLSLITMISFAFFFNKCIKKIDRYSIKDLHDETRVLSLEQRRKKQVLSLMYMQSRNGLSSLITYFEVRVSSIGMI